MLIVHRKEGGKLVLNWMWLPTFIGQNVYVMSKLESVWDKWFPDGVPDTTKDMREVHDRTVEWLVSEFKLPCLKRVLGYLEHVELEGEVE